MGVRVRVCEGWGGGEGAACSSSWKHFWLVFAALPEQTASATALQCLSASYWHDEPSLCLCFLIENLKKKKKCGKDETCFSVKLFLLNRTLWLRNVSKKKICVKCSRSVCNTDHRQLDASLFDEITSTATLTFLWPSTLRRAEALFIFFIIFLARFPPL